jgi:hypothetical protein
VTFDEMVIVCKRRGEPFKSLFRKGKEGYQANIDSRFQQGAFASAFGKTPTEALENVMIQRGWLPPKETKIEDLI